MDDLIDMRELCSLARMGPAGYRNLRRQGKTPPAYKIGRRLFFKRDEVEHWLTTVRIVPVPLPAPTEPRPPNAEKAIE